MIDDANAAICKSIIDSNIVFNTDFTKHLNRITKLSNDVRRKQGKNGFLFEKLLSQFNDDHVEN